MAGRESQGLKSRYTFKFASLTTRYFGKMMMRQNDKEGKYDPRKLQETPIIKNDIDRHAGYRYVHTLAEHGRLPGRAARRGSHGLRPEAQPRGVAAASRGRPWLRASGRSTQVKRMQSAQGSAHSLFMGRRAGCPVHFGTRRETRLPRPAAGGAQPHGAQPHGAQPHGVAAAPRGGYKMKRGHRFASATPLFRRKTNNSGKWLHGEGGGYWLDVRVVGAGRGIAGRRCANHAETLERNSEGCHVA